MKIFVRKYDDSNPTKEDVIIKGKFKELFNVICKSNDHLSKKMLY